MSEEKKIKVSFFKVVMPEGEQRSFAEVLDHVASVPPGPKRLHEIDGIQTMVHTLLHHGTFWDGDAVRIRMTRLPALARLNGALDDLPLSDDEGLGEETAFAFGERTGAIAIENNHFGVSATRLQRYLTEKSQAAGPIIFDPIVREDVWAKLAAMDEVRAVEFAVAGLSGNNAIDLGDKAVESVIQLGALTDAPTVQVRLAMGHQRGSMPVRGVRALLRNLGDRFHKAGLQPTKLRVLGQDDEGASQILDLLSMQVSHATTVEYDARRNRRVPFELRLHAVHEAWRRCGAEVERLVRQEEE